MYIFRGKVSPWGTWVLGLTSHTQGFVSTILSLLKKDLREAVLQFVLGPCGYKTAAPEKFPEKTRPLSNTSLVPPDEEEQFKAEAGENRESEGSDDMGLPIQGSDFEFVDEVDEYNDSS